MKKRTIQIISLLLALFMILSAGMSVLAADNVVHTITVMLNEKDTGGHQYGAYQVFKGNSAATDDGDVLSNIEWGDSITDSAALLTALKAATFQGAKADDDTVIYSEKPFDTCTTAEDVAKVLALFSDTDMNISGDLDTFASIVHKYLKEEPAATSDTTASEDTQVTISVTGSGYYMVKDLSVTGTDAAHTRYLLKVAGDTQMVVKSEVPDGNKSVFIDQNGTGSANNAGIGSHVSYKITSKVPNYTGYDYYYFIMNDRLSDGLTLDYHIPDAADETDTTSLINSFTVTIGGTSLTKDTDYYIYTGNDAGDDTFRIAFANIMNYDIGADIEVTYSATVNDKAIVGTTGNPNTWTLQYSNNPGSTTDKNRPDDETRPGLPKDETTEPFGHTPEKKTLTYTSELDITKYAKFFDEKDITKNLLAGAEFTLTGTSKQVVLSSVPYYRVATADDAGKTSFWLLTDGTYTDQEPTGLSYVPFGVGKADTTEGYIKDTEGNYVIPDDTAVYNGKTLYKMVKGTGSKYANPNVSYVQDVKETISYVDAPISMELTTGEDGKIQFPNLGEGTYTLKETITPDGYNTMDPITFKLTFTAPVETITTGEETCIWDIEVVSGEFETTQGGNEHSTGGVFSGNIVNTSGLLIPSTGGIGTTIFYVVGGLVVFGAAAVLVMKKRMAK